MATFERTGFPNPQGRQVLLEIELITAGEGAKVSHLFIHPQKDILKMEREVMRLPGRYFFFVAFIFLRGPHVKLWLGM